MHAIQTRHFTIVKLCKTTNTKSNRLAIECLVENKSLV